MATFVSSLVENQVEINPTLVIVEVMFWGDDLEIDHIVPVFECLPKALDVSNLAPICKECPREKTNQEQPRGARSKIGPRLDRLIGRPERVAEEMTYDLEMEGPNHNYLANNIIVHNSFNEYSGRYTKMKPEFYVPHIDNMRQQTGKPGSYQFNPLRDKKKAARLRSVIEEMGKECWVKYEHLLEQKIAKEVARMVLPVNMYTQFTWSVNLRSLLNFISLRSHETAMYEIRQYSKCIEAVIQPIVPRTMECFEASGRVAP